MYAEIKEEIINDPLNLGLKTHADYVDGVPLGNFNGIADILNGLEGAGVSTIAGDSISGSDFLVLLDPTELQSITSAQLGVVQLYAIAQSVPIGSTDFQSWVNTTFPSGSRPKTNATLTAQATRPCSRAEALCGSGTRLSGDDVATAMRS